MEHTEHQQFSSSGPIPVVSPPGPKASEPVTTDSPTLTSSPPKKSANKMVFMILLGVIVLAMVLISVGLLSSMQSQTTKATTTEEPIVVLTPTTAPTPTPSSPQIISARTKLDALQATLGDIDPYDPSLSLPVAQSSLGF